MISKIKKKFFTDWFPNWSPDAALRYLPVVSEILHDPLTANILDVGSGSLGITPYLRRHVTGVDTTFPYPHSPLLKRVVGRADRLPFRNNSFDTVVCVDVLEHIQPKDRKTVVRELFRVAKRKVLIVFPCGKKAHKEDVFFHSYVKRLKGSEDLFLEEHIDYGLPTKNEIISNIPEGYDIKARGLTNIYLHRIILLAQFSSSRVGRFISSIIFVLLISLFRHINLSPTYRKFITVEKYEDFQLHKSLEKPIDLI